MIPEEISKLLNVQKIPAKGLKDFPAGSCRRKRGVRGEEFDRMTTQESDAEERLMTQQNARQLGHDIKNQLFVVSTGLQVLESVQTDAQKFAEVLQMIRQDGLEPLNSSIKTLLSMAQTETKS